VPAPPVVEQRLHCIAEENGGLTPRSRMAKTSRRARESSRISEVGPGGRAVPKGGVSAVRTLMASPTRFAEKDVVTGLFRRAA
jgi:hypothetical protein